MTRLRKYLLLFLLAFNGNAFHAIHISYGEASLSNYQFAGKVTFNKPDFIEALKNLKGKPLTGLSNKEFDDLKLTYLNNHLQLQANNPEGMKLQVISNNEDGSSIWFYFRCNSANKITSLKIHYDVLLEEFADQMNILNIISSSEKLNKIFNKSTTDVIIK
jgi:hypothetical protein